MKRIVTLFVILVLLQAIAFAGGKAEKSSAPEVAVCFPGSVEFFSVEKKGMDAAAEKFGLKLVYSDAEWDPGRQLSQVENFVAKGVDMILLCSADNQALIPAIAKCNEAKIPLLTFTNTLGPSPDGVIDGVVTFVGVNEVDLGRLMGQMAEKVLGNKPADIVLIEGTPGTAPQRMRTDGFKEVVAKHPNWKIVYSQAITGWTKEGALAAMEAFLQTGQNVDLVSCQWHAAASAASSAIMESGLSKKVYVTGLEFSKELIPMIKEGKVDMTSNYSIYDMGFKTVEAASKYLKGETLPKSISVAPYIVDKANVDTVVPEL